MAFHVEISSGFRQRARAFNLDEAKLRATVLEPWVQGRRVHLGEKDFEPRDSKLVVLEGPELADVDLSMGRGWSNAEKASENVTRKLVEAASVPAKPVVAILAEDDVERGQVAGMLGRLELELAPWDELRSRILGARAPAGRPGYAAILALGGGVPSASWLFDAGLARGALGARALVVQLGEAAIPAQLAGVEVMRLDPGEESSVRALGDRLVG
jgi:hypothetical protein